LAVVVLGCLERLAVEFFSSQQGWKKVESDGRERRYSRQKHERDKSGVQSRRRHRCRRRHRRRRRRRRRRPRRRRRCGE